MRLHTLPNYKGGALHQLVFLDLTISRAGTGQPERIELTNAIVGQGQLKAGERSIDSPAQIQLVRTFTNGRPSVTDRFEHPLSGTVELTAADGKLSRQLISENSGHLSVRFPYEAALIRFFRRLKSVRPVRTV